MRLHWFSKTDLMCNFNDDTVRQLSKSHDKVEHEILRLSAISMVTSYDEADVQCPVSSVFILKEVIGILSDD